MTLGGSGQPLGLAFDLAGARCAASRSNARSFIVQPLPEVGRWTADAWVLMLKRAAITALVSDGAPDGPVELTLAVPAWLGMRDRHALRAAIDPDDELAISLVSSTWAATVADAQQRTERPDGPTLCIDARRGWSAGLASIEDDRLVEVQAWGCDPWTEGGDLTEHHTCRALLHELLDRHAEVGSVIVLDDEEGTSAVAIETALRSIDASRTFHVVTADRASRLVTQGATMLAGAPHRAAGAFPHELLVATGDARSPDGEMLVVAARHAPMPSSSRHTFDLGPNDEVPLYFDVLERHHGTGAPQPIVRAQLLRERGYDLTMEVTFGLSANGLFTVAPRRAWQLSWLPGRLHVDADDVIRNDTPSAGARPTSRSTP